MPNALDRKMMDDYSARWAGDDKKWMKTLFELMQSSVSSTGKEDVWGIEAMHLIAEVYVQGWQDGFTARLSGVEK